MWCGRREGAPASPSSHSPVTEPGQSRPARGPSGAGGRWGSGPRVGGGPGEQTANAQMPTQGAAGEEGALSRSLHQQ